MRTVQHVFTMAGVASALALGLFVAQPAAQARPSDATARCKDGTYSTAAARQSACADHGGVDIWYADTHAKRSTKRAAKDVKRDSKSAAKSTKDAGKDVGAAAADAGKSIGKAAKNIGKATADAAKETGKAAGTAGKQTAKTAKRGSKRVAATAKDAVTRPADAPSDATGKCTDGTYTHAASRQGACEGHGGVAAWYK